MIELVPSNATWNYQSAPNVVPVDLFNVTIPSAGWSQGAAPFGEGVIPPELDPVSTTWTRNTGLWIERDITLTRERILKVSGNIEQALYVFWDGVYVASINPTNASEEIFRNWVVSIQGTIGTHTLSILCLDDIDIAGACYLSVKIEGMGALFPFQPVAPINEKLDYKTDVLTTDNGLEARIKLRSKPRRSYQLSYPSSFANKPRGQNILRSGIRSELLFPIWTEAVPAGAVSANQQVITCNYSPTWFGDYVLLWRTDEDWQLLGFDEYIDGSSFRVSNLTREFASCWVMPVRRAYYASGFTKRTTGYEAFYDVNISLIDNYRKTPNNAPGTFLGVDYYLRELETSNGVSEENTAIDMKVFDGDAGVVTTTTSWLQPETMRQMYFINDNFSDMSDMFSLIERCAGRYKEFWYPSFDTDLTPQGTGIIGSTLAVKKDGWLESDETRQYIGINAKNGFWYLREISSFTEFSPTTMGISVTSAFSIAYEDIARVCWLSVRRLDTDSIVVSHRTGGITTCSFMTVETTI